MKIGIFSSYGDTDESLMQHFGLREINYARSRIAVFWAFLNAIQKTSIENIRITDLCRAAEISEPSFYNYFPRKDDLFLYFISMWSLDVQLQTKGKKPGMQTIQEVFSYTAEKSSRFRNLLPEIIAYQARTDIRERIKEIKPASNAEKMLIFGRVEGLEQLPAQGLGPILEANINAALAQGELNPEIDSSVYTLMLASFFFGIPVLARQYPPGNLSKFFSMALNAMLIGFKGKKEKIKRS